MFFYHHYIQKGYKPEYLENLPFYTRKLMEASLDIEIEKEQNASEIRGKLLKDEKAFPVVAF